jgi:hypothetical protein
MVRLGSKLRWRDLEWMAGKTGLNKLAGPSERDVDRLGGSAISPASSARGYGGSKLDLGYLGAKSVERCEMFAEAASSYERSGIASDLSILVLEFFICGFPTYKLIPQIHVTEPRATLEVQS